MIMKVTSLGGALYCRAAWVIAIASIRGYLLIWESACRVLNMLAMTTQR